MRFLIRFSSFIMLALAVTVATFDAIQSVSASAMVYTTLDAALAALGLRADGQGGGNAVSALAGRLLVEQPAVLVLLAIAFLMWIVAYKRRPAAKRFRA